MKNLNEYLNEQLNEGNLVDYAVVDQTDEYEVAIRMYDKRGKGVEFDEHDIEQLYSEYCEFDGDELSDPSAGADFAEKVFDEYRKADQISLELLDEDTTQIYVIQRDTMTRGWQKTN